MAAKDDEAERRIRRSEASLDVSASSSNSIAADNENTKICLKLYSDNKLSKENAKSPSAVQLEKPKRPGHRKKSYELDTLDDVLSLNENLFVEYNPDRPIRGITYPKSSKKWNARKLKLPTDYDLDRDRFDVWQYARGLTIGDNDVVGSMEHAPSEEYNTGDGQVSSNNDIHEGSDNHMDMEQDGPFLPLPSDATQPPAINAQDKTLLQNVTVDAISTEFKGAPDKVNKMHIAHAKTAKVIDMKQLKHNCWRLISSQVMPEQPAATQMGSQPDVPLSSTQSEHGQIKFSALYQQVPQLLSKPMSENISKSLAFYAVLHLANEKSLSLEGQEDLKDFTIKQVEL